MAFTVNAEGAKLTDGTEQTLKDETAPAGKTFQLWLDRSVMANDDKIELRIYTKVRSTGTLRVAFFQRYSHDPGADDENVFSIPIIGMSNIKATITRIGGTDRTYNWELLEQ